MNEVEYGLGALQLSIRSGAFPDKPRTERKRRRKEENKYLEQSDAIGSTFLLNMFALFLLDKTGL
jgi:hypothetical protein